MLTILDYDRNDRLIGAIWTESEVSQHTASARKLISANPQGSSWSPWGQLLLSSEPFHYGNREFRAQLNVLGSGAAAIIWAETGTHSIKAASVILGGLDNAADNGAICFASLLAKFPRPIADVRESRRPLVATFFGSLAGQRECTITEAAIAVARELCARHRISDEAAPLGTPPPTQESPVFWSLTYGGSVRSTLSTFPADMLRATPDAFSFRALTRHDRFEKTVSTCSGPAKVEYRSYGSCAIAKIKLNEEKSVAFAVCLTGTDASSEAAHVGAIESASAHRDKESFFEAMTTVYRGPRPMLFLLQEAATGNDDFILSSMSMYLAAAFFDASGVWNTGNRANDLGRPNEGREL
jgi:hypothetical protein